MIVLQDLTNSEILKKESMKWWNSEEKLQLTYVLMNFNHKPQFYIPSKFGFELNKL